MNAFNLSISRVGACAVLIDKPLLKIVFYPKQEDQIGGDRMGKLTHYLNFPAAPLAWSRQASKFAAASVLERTNTTQCNTSLMETGNTPVGGPRQEEAC